VGGRQLVLEGGVLDDAGERVLRGRLDVVGRHAIHVELIALRTPSEARRRRGGWKGREAEAKK